MREMLRTWERGRFVFTDDFASLESLGSVRIGLCQLVKDGVLHRIARGIYYYAGITGDINVKTSFVMPSEETIAYAVAERERIRIIPYGDQAIYEQDTTWLRECDMVIAECTNASLGVGYEMAYAELHKKPVHIFYDRTRARLSAMLSGDPYFHLHPYANEEELFRILGDVLRCPCSKTGCPRFGNCEECRKHHEDSSKPRPCER